MRRVIALAALALGLAPVASQAHGPGGDGQPWNQQPTKDYIHAHCSTQYSANEFFIHIPGTFTAGAGKHTQSPTATDDIYIFVTGAPAMDDPVEVRNSPAAPMTVGGCGDSTLP